MTNNSAITNNIEQLVATALAEDLGLVGDLTSTLTVPEAALGTAKIVAREPGVLSGGPAVVATLAAVDPGLELDWSTTDGQRVVPGQEILRVTGRARSILTSERTALNFLGQLSELPPGQPISSTWLRVRVCGSWTLERRRRG